MSSDNGKNDGGSSRGVRIGILAVQGDVAENTAAVSAALKDPRGFDDDSVIHVKTPQQASTLDGLVIPGGESTSIGKLSHANGTLEVLQSRIQNDSMPVLGICAGLIMLAKSADDRVIGAMERRQPLLGMLDVAVERNAFGRQRQSFEAKISLATLAISNFKGVFIRAPVISDVGSDVRVLCELPPAPNTPVKNDDDSGKKRIVAVSQGNMLGVAFHPELSGDNSIHKHFVDMVRRHKRG